MPSTFFPNKLHFWIQTISFLPSDQIHHFMDYYSDKNSDKLYLIGSSIHRSIIRCMPFVVSSHQMYIHIMMKMWNFIGVKKRMFVLYLIHSCYGYSAVRWNNKNQNDIINRNDSFYEWYGVYDRYFEFWGVNCVIYSCVHFFRLCKLIIFLYRLYVSRILFYFILFI